MSKSKMNIGIVLYPNVLRSAVYGLQELFLVANRKTLEEGREDTRLFEVQCWADEEHSVDGFDALSMTQTSAALDLLIVPPAMGEGPPSSISESMQSWLNTQHQQGCIFSSACVGAFVLAETGVLNGRTCTTHWSLANTLAQKDKSIVVDTDKILIDDGDVITAGGVMAWMDLGLHVIHRFAGPKLVMALSKFFVVDTGHREQKFYQDFTPQFGHGDIAITKLQQYLQTHYSENIDLQKMSAVSHIGERTLQRRFNTATGFSPTVYLQRLRIQKAKERLETTQSGIDQIAWAVGYEDLSAFRKRFKQWVGLSPSEYRKRFLQAGLELT